jgi:hypothetical protein
MGNLGGSKRKRIIEISEAERRLEEEIDSLKDNYDKNFPLGVR